jgi:beta-N-acetylhexosaminidase
MDEIELYPYRVLIKEGLPAVMTAHNAYTALEEEGIPASVSERIVTGLLREEMGFEGVVTTDAIGMAGLIEYAGSQPRAAVMALKAGNDIVLVKEDEQTTAKCFQAVMDAVEAGELTEERLDQSVKRILSLKDAMGILDNPLPDPEKADAAVRNPENAEICTQAYRKASLIARDRSGAIPLDPDEPVFVVEQYLPLYHVKGNDAWCHPGMFGEAMRSYTGNMIYEEMETPPTDEQMERFRDRLGQVNTVVFYNTFWRGSGSNRPLIRESLKKGKKVIVAANDIYDSYFLPEVDTLICTFGAMPAGLRTAADIIYGKVSPGGTWPLSRISREDTVDKNTVVDHFVAGHFAHR